MITIFLGDSQELDIDLAWEGEDFEPGEDWGLLFTVKASASDADSLAKIQKATGAGITVADEVATIELVPADTSSLAAGRYLYDIQAQHVTTGEVRTVAFGKLELVRDITRSTTSSVPIRTTQPPYPSDIPASISDADALAPIVGDEKLGLEKSGSLFSLTLSALKTWLEGAMSLAWASITGKPSFGTASLVNTGTTSGTVPLIGAGDKLPASVIPAVDLVDSVAVANQAARLALTLAQAQSKIVVQTDDGTSWMLIEGGTPATAGDWLQVGDRAITTADISDATSDGATNTGKVLKTDAFGIVTVSSITLTGGVTFTNGGYTGDLGSTLTGNRTWTLPDVSGTVVLTGATQTLTNKTIDAPTISGAASFTSTTRPTSSGTGTPNSDSLITRVDGDTRYGHTQYARLSSNESITNSTTFTAVGPTLTLEAGTYEIETLISFYNASAAPGWNGGFIASQAITFMGRVETAVNGSNIGSTTWGNDSITTLLSAAAGQYGVARQIGVIVIPSSTTLRLGIAQNSASGDATIANANSFLKVTKLS